MLSFAEGEDDIQRPSVLLISNICVEKSRSAWRNVSSLVLSDGDAAWGVRAG